LKAVSTLTKEAAMARISVLGGTGYGGGAVVREAARRGHEVVAVSRTPSEAPVPDVTYVTGSVLDPDVLKAAVTDADVVFEALSPRGDMAGKVDDVFAALVALAEETGTRLGVLGGASSLLVSAHGPRLLDVAPVEPEVLPEVMLGIHKLETLRESAEGLDWFYVSPAAEFGAWVPSAETGEYRSSDDVLLRDADGRSEISAADLAIAVVDEIENPTHRRRRFHVAH
jgi:putative NADH-flavin reductase